MLVPEHVQSKVLATVWREADDANWDHLTQAEKARLLDLWIQSDSVGGLLRPLLLTDAAVRLWLKDVAIKKRARSKMPSSATVVRACLPSASSIVPDTEGIKPHHCKVLMDSGATVYVCWGTAANAKHLYWAALNAALDDTAIAMSYVVFIDLGLSRTKAAVKQRLHLIADRCGITVKWMSA